MLQTTPLVSHVVNATEGVHRSPATLEGVVALMGNDRTKDPVRLAELVKLAAGATRRAAPGPQKRYARALKISSARASRHLNGEDPHTPAVRLLSAVEALASGEYTSALPLLMEAFAVALEALSRRSTPDLEARLRELKGRRVEQKAALDRARLKDDEGGVVHGGEDTDNATLAVAEIDVEIVTIKRILRERAERAKR